MRNASPSTKAALGQLTESTQGAPQQVMLKGMGGWTDGGRGAKVLPCISLVSACFGLAMVLVSFHVFLWVLPVAVAGKRKMWQA